MNLFNDAKVVLAKAAAVAGTSAVESDVIDTANFEGAAFIGSIGTANAGNFVKLQQGDASDGSDMADLTGTKLVTGDDGDSYLADVYRPRKRYVRAVVTRGASTTSGDIYAILYSGRECPVSHGSTIDSEMHTSPEEGTA